MTKYFILLLIAVSLSVSFGLSADANKNQSASFSPTPTPKPLAEIERIELDRNEVVIPCPPLVGILSKTDSPCYNDNGLIVVKTIVNNPWKVPLTYQYKVSGGRIVGEGEKVTWDLNGVRPGTYQISAAINKGLGFGKETEPLIIEIKDTCCCISCICPDFSVTKDGNVKAGETATFTANVTGGTAVGFTYNWTVSQGEIVEGQGTSTIKVKTTREMTGIITATVEIDSSGLCDMCKRTESETAKIDK